MKQQTRLQNVTESLSFLRKQRYVPSLTPILDTISMRSKGALTTVRLQ